MDDVLMMGGGSIENIQVSEQILKTSKKAIGMHINVEKLNLAGNLLSEELDTSIRDEVSFPLKPLSIGFKYLGLYLNPNSYSFKNGCGY